MKKTSFALSLLAALFVATNVLNAQTEATPESAIPDAVRPAQEFAVTVRFETRPAEGASDAIPLTHEQPGMAYGNDLVFTAIPPEEIANSDAPLDITIVRGELRISVKEAPVAFQLPSGKMVMTLESSGKLEAPTKFRVAQEAEELFLVTSERVKKIPPPKNEALQYLGALIVNERGEFWGIATWSWWKENPTYDTVGFPEILAFLHH